MQVHAKPAADCRELNFNTRRTYTIMKTNTAILLILSVAVIALIASCSSPVESRESLPQPVKKSQIKYEVTQKQGKDNIVYLKSNTQGVIPYWDWGSGTSTSTQDTVIFPFSGDYMIHYNVSSGGGFVKGDSTKIHVSKTDLSYLNNPEWGQLTGGQQGKTWELDMAKPIGWYGFDYLKGNGSADDWSWHPDYQSNQWVMPDRYYGSMTFDLNNGKNVEVDSVGVNGQTVTCKGSFNMDLDNHSLNFNNCDLLFGGSSYYVQVPDWRSTTILDLTDSTMTLGVKRHYPDAGGDCWIGFTYKVKK